MKDVVVISKRLSYVLRHAPQSAGLELDEHGWTDVEVLLTALELDRTTLDEVVATNDKQRFAIQPGPTGDRIRASQGHSVSVDLKLDQATPPDTLLHGTIDANRESIQRQGLTKRQRHHVHLSKDEQTARVVGARRDANRVIILRVDAQRMARDGFTFFRSANGVWLTDRVPSEYITE